MFNISLFYHNFSVTGTDMTAANIQFVIMNSM